MFGWILFVGTLLSFPCLIWQYMRIREHTFSPVGFLWGLLVLLSYLGAFSFTLFAFSIVTFDWARLLLKDMVSDQSRKDWSIAYGMIVAGFLAVVWHQFKASTRASDWYETALETERTAIREALSPKAVEKLKEYYAKRIKELEELPEHEIGPRGILRRELHMLRKLSAMGTVTYDCEAQITEEWEC
jgi:signal transduction histidine kinase